MRWNIREWEADIVFGMGLAWWAGSAGPGALGWVGLLQRTNDFCCCTDIDGVMRPLACSTKLLTCAAPYIEESMAGLLGIVR